MCQTLMLSASNLWVRKHRLSTSKLAAFPFWGLLHNLIVHIVLTQTLTLVMQLQDDLLYESLTVWETLYFAAMLRLPRDFTTEQKKQRVAKVIAALGLNRCKDTIIGTNASTSAGPCFDISFDKAM